MKNKEWRRFTLATPSFAPIATPTLICSPCSPLGLEELAVVDASVPVFVVFLQNRIDQPLEFFVRQDLWHSGGIVDTG